MTAAVAVGVATAVVAFLAAVGVFALPLFGLAQALEPGSGVDRPFIRNGLLGVALPGAAVVGVVAGALAARWYGRRSQ